MRNMLLIIPLFCSSCSLIFSPEERVSPEAISSDKNHISLSVASERFPLLTSEDLSTEEFPVRLSYDGGGFCEGTIRLRGNASLKQTPRSFAIDLRQDSSIVVQTTAVERFSLIPMMSDINLIYTLTGLFFARKCNLFAPKFVFTSLTLNNETFGSYILIERSSDALVRINPETEFVLRRRNGHSYDLKYYEPKDRIHQLSRGDYATSYETLHTLSSLYKDEELITVLNQRMDLSSYLRLQGLNLILANGDYGDELFYAGSAKRDEINITHPYFTFSVWDYGELFTEPHHGNFTPGSLIFCNENRFDKMIETEPKLYNYYCEELQYVLHEVITQENIIEYQAFVRVVLETLSTTEEIRLGHKIYSKAELLRIETETISLLQRRKEMILHSLN